MKLNSLEITDKKEQLKLRCKEIINTCKVEIREMSEDEEKEFNDAKEEIKSLNEQLEELQAKLAQYEEEPIEEEENNTNSNKRTKTINSMNTEFRLIKAINDIANNRSLDNVASAVISKGTEEMRKSGLSYGGQIQLPTEELRATITVESEGEDVVATELYNIIEPLRAKNVLVQAGAKFLTNLVGDVQVPIMGASNVTWEGETADAKDGAGAFSNVKLQPKRLTAYIDISKQFLAQDSLSAEALIRQDLINAINSKLEATILGSETGANQPSGLFNGITATSVSDFAGVCDLEAAIEDANVIGECKYVMSNKAKAAFRNMSKSTKSTQLVMEGGMIDGTPVLNTSNVEGKNFIYGDFSNLAIGQWGGIDLTVDPYTKAAQGQVRLVVNAYFDAKVLRPEAFAFGTL